MKDVNLFNTYDLIWLTIWGSFKGDGLRVDSLARVDCLVGVEYGMKCKLGGGGGR